MSVRDWQTRLQVLELRGVRALLWRQQDKFCIDLTLLLQTQAVLLRNKAVSLEAVPTEALRALNYESLILIRDIFERRLNAETGWNEPVEDWVHLLAQFIPKQGGDLSRIDSWRAILVGSSVQKWYLTILLSLAEPVLEKLPSYIMGFRRGFQTAMLVEPLRIALRLANEWGDPIAIGGTDAEAAFESIQHSTLIAGWEYLGAHPLLTAGFYRELSHADAQVVICGEAGGSAKLRGGGRPGNVCTPAHWNVSIGYVLRKLVPSWIARDFGYVRSGRRLLILVWADDFTFIASSVGQL